jgi:hypothetical protein
MRASGRHIIKEHLINGRYLLCSIDLKCEKCFRTLSSFGHQSILHHTSRIDNSNAFHFTIDLVIEEDNPSFSIKNLWVRISNMFLCFDYPDLKELAELQFFLFFSFDSLVIGSPHSKLTILFISLQPIPSRLIEEFKNICESGIPRLSMTCPATYMISLRELRGNFRKMSENSLFHIYSTKLPKRIQEQLIILTTTTFCPISVDEKGKVKTTFFESVFYYR